MGYLRERDIIIKLQARFRGILTRRKTFLFLAKRSISIRQKVLHLWRSPSIYRSEFYRSVFWLYFEDVTAVNLSIFQEELDYLRKDLKNQSNNSHNYINEYKALREDEKKRFSD